MFSVQQPKHYVHRLSTTSLKIESSKLQKDILSNEDGIKKKSTTKSNEVVLEIS